MTPEEEKAYERGAREGKAALRAAQAVSGNLYDRLDQLEFAVSNNHVIHSEFQRRMEQIEERLRQLTGPHFYNTPGVGDLEPRPAATGQKAE